MTEFELSVYRGNEEVCLQTKLILVHGKVNQKFKLDEKDEKAKKSNRKGRTIVMNCLYEEVMLKE